MKKFHVIVLLLFFIAGCKKDNTDNKPPEEHKNTAPVAIAGNDTTIYWPSAYAVLNGDASYDPDGPAFLSYKWRLVSGPTPGMISNYENSYASVGYLIYPGEYEFELSVKEQQGSGTSDRMKVTVVDRECTSKTNEIILKDQAWFTDPEWYVTSIGIDLTATIPPNSNFREVYMKSDTATEWSRVRVYDPYSQDYFSYPTYSYGFDGLYIYPAETYPDTGTPDIKIIYCKSEGTE